MPAARALLAFLAVQLLWGVAPAVAQDEGAAADAQVTPTVSFVETDPLEVELDDVTERKPAGVRVLIHNDLGRRQSASVRVLGLDKLEDREARSLLSAKPQRVRLAPGQIGSVLVPAGNGRPTETDATYSLTLVAGGSAGGSLARTQLTIVAKDPEGAGTSDDGDGTPALGPDDAHDVTISATNYAPSPLSALDSFAFALAVLAALMAVVVWTAMPKAGLFLVAVGVAAAAIGLAASIEGNVLEDGSVAAVEAPSLAVTSDSPIGKVGVLSDASGDLASLVVAQEEMQADGLPHAGSFKGPYDLAPDVAEVGGATATVNVRDWWPYALLALALGVGLGMALRRWYRQQRPQQKLRLQRSRVLALHAEEEERFKAAAARRPYAGLEIPKRLAARLAAIDGKIAEGDPKAAEALESLNAYLAQFRRLRESVELLYADRERLDQLRKKNDFGLRADEIDLYDPIDSAFSPQLDSDAAYLKAAQKAVDDARALAAVAEDVHGEVAVGLDEAQAALERTSDPTERQRLTTLIQSLEQLGRKLLRSTTAAAAQKVGEEYDTKVDELRLPLVVLPARRSVGDSLALAAAVGRAHGARRLALTAAIDEDEEEQRPQLDVHYEVRGEPGVRRPAVYRDDEVVVQVAASTGAGAVIRGFEVDFGDGSDPETLKVEPRPGPVACSVSRRMSQPGRRRIVVRTVPRGNLVEEMVFAVDSRSRVELEEQALKRKDKMMDRLAFVVALGSGLTALYITDPSWGESGDYLVAALWGAAAAEGVKLASWVADRSWAP